MLPFNYTIIRKNVKHTRIRVAENNSVRIIVPLDYSSNKISSIVNSKEKWINKNLNYFSKRKSNQTQTVKQLLLGKKFRVITRSELKEKFIIDFNAQIIYTKSKISKSFFFDEYLKLYANEYLKKRAQELAAKYKLKYNRIFIRDSYTKWGNCSKLKNISLNWRLIHSPEFVIDYIILHELLHTKIMNHSKLFWLKLSALIPQIDEAIKWLSKYGYNLF